MKQKTLSRNRLFAFCALGALGALATSIQTHAAVVVTEHGPYGEAGGLTNAEVIAIHPVAIGDVLELPSTTRSIVSGRVRTEWGGSEGVINDGLARDATGGIFYVENGTQLEFQISPIDVARIDLFMFADWSRTSAWVDVHTSADGGANWSLLHEVRQAEQNGGSVDREYNVHSLTDTTGTLASGINALRFTFLGDGMGADESGYVEIDVHAVPEPATVSLAALGLLLLGRRRRR